MKPNFIPPPGTIAPPKKYVPPPEGEKEPVSAGERIDWTSDGSSKRPLIDLLHPQAPAEEASATAAVPVAAAPVAKRKVPVALIAVAAVVVAAGAYAALARPWAGKPVVAPISSPSASASPSPAPSPAPSPTPSPTPNPTPSPELTITAPTTAPTADHPQTLTVTSKSGLWLRSSPTSVNKSNVIGWMPNGAQVSVDATGDFWWHGTYKSTAGYFASKYTQ
jgi:hypothetical protein